MDFFASQDRARRNTGMLVFLYVLAVLAIIVGVYLAVRGIVFYQQATETGETIPFFDPKLMAYIGGGTIIVVGGATLIKIMELQAGGEVVAKSLGGRRLAPGSVDPVERQVLNVVEEMAIASGMAVPDVYMLDNEQRINAFAAGHTVDTAVIGVTRGCAERLSRDELQGVMAHEFSHILHGDMKLNLRLIGVLHGILVIGLIGSILMRNAYLASGSRSSRDGKGAIVMIVLGLALFVIGMLGTLFGRLIQAAVSRQREFLADASAVRFTRQPSGIAGALKRIGARKNGSRIGAAKVEEFRHMYFGAGTSEFLAMLATHPPLEERIRRIEPRWDGRFPEPKAPPLPSEPPPVKVKRGRDQKEVLRDIMTAGVLTGAVAQVGRPSHSHLEQAKALLERIPKRLTDAVHTLVGAHGVVCATLIDTDRASRQKQLVYLEGRDAQLRDDVVNYVSLMQSLGPRVRLPLVELAMPTLRHMNESEYRRLMEDVDYLSRTDALIEPFEWVLGRVLHHHLEPGHTKEKKSRARQGKLADSRDAVARLLTQLARAGHGDPAMQDQAFAAGAAALGDGMDLAMVDPAQSTLPALDAAVDELTLLLATEKKRLLEACAAVIGADNQVTTTEGELLRGISDVFECPMPVI
ncbi:MAG: M48 family metallopeptidase [Planctomycetota bacterium]|jgi:Zn-dependent protease with chaperone function